MKTRRLACLLAALLLCLLLPCAALAAYTPPFSPLPSVNITANRAGSVTSLVDFGGHTWYVIGSGADQLYLLSQTNITGEKYGLVKSTNGLPFAGMKYNTSGATQYTDSDLQKKLAQVLAMDVSQREQAAIAPRTLDATSDSVPPEGQLLWPLSKADFDALYSDDSRSLRNSGDHWWLRTQGGEYNAYVWFVDAGGDSYADYSRPNEGRYGLRPGTYLDMDKVVMLSNASGGKGAAGAAGLQPFMAESNHYKLTLLDESLQPRVIQVLRSDDDKITFRYYSEKTASNLYLSALVVDEQTGKIAAYGRIRALSADAEKTGEVTLQLSPAAAIAPQARTVYTFIEEYNGDGKTDYASPLTELAPLHTLAVPQGADGTWQLGGQTGYDLTCQSGADTLVEVRVDGVLCGADYYAFARTASGDTFTFAPAYLDTLAPGAHTVYLLYRHGEAEASLTLLPAPPKTGDENPVELLWLLLALSSAALAAIGAATRRKNARSNG